MPNIKGGKNYKKSKHGTVYKPVMIDRQPGQMYGRIIRNVGGDRMLVFCNDGKTRTCHIRGSMRKKVWMKIGDIILLSLREMDDTINEKDMLANMVGDIIAKYDEDLISELKKDPAFNQILLRSLETQDGKLLVDLGSLNKEKQAEILGDDDDGGIEFDRGSGSEEDDDVGEEGSEASEAKKLAKRKAEEAKEKGRLLKEMERKGPENDEVNIDDI